MQLTLTISSTFFLDIQLVCASIVCLIIFASYHLQHSKFKQIKTKINTNTRPLTKTHIQTAAAITPNPTDSLNMTQFDTYFNLTGTASTVPSISTMTTIDPDSEESNTNTSLYLAVVILGLLSLVCCCFLYAVFKQQILVCLGWLIIHCCPECCYCDRISQELETSAKHNNRSRSGGSMRNELNQDSQTSSKIYDNYDAKNRSKYKRDVNNIAMDLRADLEMGIASNRMKSISSGATRGAGGASMEPTFSKTKSKTTRSRSKPKRIETITRAQTYTNGEKMHNNNDKSVESKVKKSKNARNTNDIYGYNTRVYTSEESDFDVHSYKNRSKKSKHKSKTKIKLKMRRAKRNAKNDNNMNNGAIGNNPGSSSSNNNTPITSNHSDQQAATVMFANNNIHKNNRSDAKEKHARSHSKKQTFRVQNETNSARYRSKSVKDESRQHYYDNATNNVVDSEDTTDYNISNQESRERARRRHAQRRAKERRHKRKQRTSSRDRDLPHHPKTTRNRNKTETTPYSNGNHPKRSKSSKRIANRQEVNYTGQSGNNSDAANYYSEDSSYNTEDSYSASHSKSKSKSKSKSHSKHGKNHKKTHAQQSHRQRGYSNNEFYDSDIAMTSKETNITPANYESDDFGSNSKISSKKNQKHRTNPKISKFNDKNGKNSFDMVKRGVSERNMMESKRRKDRNDKNRNGKSGNDRLKKRRLSKDDSHIISVVRTDENGARFRILIDSLDPNASSKYGKFGKDGPKGENSDKKGSASDNRARFNDDTEIPTTILENSNAFDKSPQQQTNNSTGNKTDDAQVRK